LLWPLALQQVLQHWNPWLNAPRPDKVREDIFVALEGFMNIFVINGYIAKIFIKPLTKGFLIFFQNDMGISCEA